MENNQINNSIKQNVEQKMEHNMESKVIKNVKHNVLVEEIFQEHLSVLILKIVENLNNLLLSIDNKIKTSAMSKYKYSAQQVLKQKTFKNFYVNSEEIAILKLFNNVIEIQFDKKQVLIPINFLKHIVQNNNVLLLNKQQLNFKIFLLCVFKIYFKNLLTSFKNKDILIIIMALFCHMFYGNYNEFNLKINEYEIKITIDKNVERLPFKSLKNIYKKYLAYINLSADLVPEINYCIGILLLESL